MLHWDNRPSTMQSSHVGHFANSKDVTNSANNCLTVQMKEGTYNFVAVASNGCSSVSSKIQVSLTDCPTCHHQEAVAGHHEAAPMTPTAVIVAPALPISPMVHTDRHTGRHTGYV